VFVYDITGRQPQIVDVPKDAAKAVAKGFNLLRSPMLTPDMVVDLWSEDFIPSMTAQEEYDAQPTKDKIFTFKDLDHIEATPIEKIAFIYLHRFTEGGHFSLEKGWYH